MSTSHSAVELDVFPSSSGISIHRSVSISTLPLPESTAASDSKPTIVESVNADIPSLERPVGGDHTSVRVTIRTKTNLWRARVQLLALCWSIYLNGWNDGSLGPLLPRIRNVYSVGFGIVSLIFVFSCAGFITGALANVHFTDKLGFGKLLFIGSLFQIVGYSLQASALPFPVFVLSYVINGIGIAIQNAQANGYVASLLDGPEVKMGLLHAAYGAGAFSSPLVATQFAQAKHWSFHYLISLGIAIVNSIILLVVFRLENQEDSLSYMGQPPATNRTASRSGNNFRQIMGLKTVHLISFFALIYVGVEVTLGGWIVQYLIDVRGGQASAGYVSSGFFGGLMVGRVSLLWLNKLIGERRVMYLYAVLAIGFEFVVWFVPSLIGNAVAVSMIGVLLGPMYPLVMNHCARVLPRWVITQSIGWVASFGQAGSAVFPLITAALASKFGIKSLQPLIVSMMAFMMTVWWVIPTRVQRAV